MAGRRDEGDRWESSGEWSVDAGTFGESETRHRARRRRISGRTRTLGIVIVAALVGGVAFGLLRQLEWIALYGDPAGAGEGSGTSPETLWDRTFYSVSVTEDGDLRPLVPGTRIEMAFERRPHWSGVKFGAGCGEYAAPVTIEAHHVQVGELVLHATGTCRDEHREQDTWLEELFASNPSWELDGARLTLVSDPRVLELTEDHIGMMAAEFHARWNRNAEAAGLPELHVAALDVGLGDIRDGFRWVLQDTRRSSAAIVIGGVNKDGSLYDVKLWSPHELDPSVRMDLWGC